MRKIWSALYCTIRQMITFKTSVQAFLSSALFVTLLPYAHQEGACLEEVVLGLIGGFEYEEIIVFKMDELFVWTMMLMSYLRCVIIPMQEEYEGRCVDSLYRFSNHRSWYVNKALAASLACIITTVIIVLGAIFGAVMWGKEWKWAIIASTNGNYAPAWQHCLISMGLLICQGIMLTQWQMLIHVITKSVVAAVAAFVIPVLLSLYTCSNSYLHPVSIQFNPINWGMYMRSNQMHTPGFSIEWAVCGQLSIAVLLALLGMKVVKKVDLARIRI